MTGGLDVPTAWTESVIVPEPKKQGASTLDNHRGISLENSAPKLFNRVLLGRFQLQVDRILLDEQNGFRPGRSTLHHVVILRRIMEETIAHKLEAHFIFVDFKKAFDSVDRTALPSLLDEFGIPASLRESIVAMYQTTKAMVRTTDGTTTPFATSTGVMQGDSLSPFIFVLFMHHIIRKAIPDHRDGFILERRRSQRHPEKRISILLYADDILLMSSSVEGAQRIALKRNPMPWVCR
jgi:hypothetical protein